MSWGRYGRYRPSGVEWPAETPAHWSTKRLRFALRMNPSRQEAKRLAADAEVSFVTMDAVGEQGGLRLDSSKPLDEIPAGYTYFADGDVLVAKITPCFENGKGAVAEGLLNGSAFGTTELHVLRAEAKALDPKFLFYLTASQSFRKLGEAAMYGAGGQKRVPEDFIKDFRATLPPLDEQQQIANRLDRETARLDSLIDKRQRMIQLLQEKRAALITHAVTRGLNPNAPLKDSGVPWLGQVPAHWAVKRLKFLAFVQSGLAKGRNLEGQNSITVPYLRVANVQDGYLDLADMAEIDILPNELARFSLRAGDLLMNEGGDNDKLGRGHIWRGEIDPCIHQNHVFAARPLKAEPEWLAWYTCGHVAKFYFYGRAKQTTNLASISARNILELPVLLPSAEERKMSIEHLDVQTAQVDELIAKVETVVEKLTEYRAALITAAVTGQIDVRT